MGIMLPQLAPVMHSSGPQHHSHLAACLGSTCRRRDETQSCVHPLCICTPEGCCSPLIYGTACSAGQCWHSSPPPPGTAKCPPISATHWLAIPSIFSHGLLGLRLLPIVAVGPMRRFAPARGNGAQGGAAAALDASPLLTSTATSASVHSSARIERRVVLRVALVTAATGSAVAATSVSVEAMSAPEYYASSPCNSASAAPTVVDFELRKRTAARRNMRSRWHSSHAGCVATASASADNALSAAVS